MSCVIACLLAGDLLRRVHEVRCCKGGKLTGGMCTSFTGSHARHIQAMFQAIGP